MAMKGKDPIMDYIQLEKEFGKKKRTGKELQAQIDQAKIIFASQIVQCLDHYWGPLMDQAIKKFLKDNK